MGKKVWVLMNSVTEYYKGPVERDCTYTYLVDVFLSKNSAVERLKELRRKEQATEEYKEFLDMEQYYVGSSYYVQYDHGKTRKTEEYYIHEKDALD